MTARAAYETQADTTPSHAPRAGAIEVLEPDSVKIELARLGSELVERYTPR